MDEFGKKYGSSRSSTWRDKSHGFTTSRSDSEDRVWSRPEVAVSQAGLVSLIEFYKMGKWKAYSPWSWRKPIKYLSFWAKVKKLTLRAMWSPQLLEIETSRPNRPASQTTFRNERSYQQKKQHNKCDPDTHTLVSSTITMEPVHCSEILLAWSL